MKHRITKDHREHFERIGTSAPWRNINVDPVEYQEAYEQWQKSMPEAGHEIWHMKALGHAAWAQHTQKPRNHSWIWPCIGVLLVIILLALPAKCQFSKINSVNFQQNGATVTNGFVTYPFAFNCTTNLTCTFANATLTMSASGGGGTFYQTFQNAGSALTQRTVANFLAGITCVDNAGNTRTDCNLTTVAVTSHKFFNAVATGSLVAAQPASTDLSDFSTTPPSSVGQLPIFDGAKYVPGDPQVQGTQAAGSTTIPNPVVPGGSDYSGTPTVRAQKVDSSGNFYVALASAPTLTVNLPTQPLLNVTDFNDVTASSPATNGLITVVGGKWAQSTTINPKNLNGALYCSQFAGADNGLRCNAAMLALPVTGGIVVNDELADEIWSTNIFSGVTASPVVLLIQNCPIIRVDTKQIPAANNIRIIGETRYCPAFVVNFASGDVFAPAGGANFFELGYASFSNAGGVTRVAGFDFNPTPPNSNGYIHDLVLQDQYGWFNFKGSTLGAINNWIVERIWPSDTVGLHVGTQIAVGTADGVSGVSDLFIHDIISRGENATHDAPQVVVDSGADTVKFSRMDMGYSAANPTTQPAWIFQNTFPALFPPRWIRIHEVSPEAPNATCFQINSGTNLAFEAIYAAGCNIGMVITGGQAISVTDGSIFGNNKAGGLYVTSAIAGLHLNVNGVTFSSNSTSASNTFDDIQITSGTTEFSITNSAFGINIFSSFSSRYGINLLASTTTSDFTIWGNRQGPSIGTAFLRDATVGINKIIQTDEGRTTLHQGASSSRIWLGSSTTHPLWQISSQEINTDCLEVAPSTTNNGTTFTTNVFTVCGGPNQGNFLNIGGPIVPFTAGAVAIGSNALPLSSIFIGAAATNNIQLTGTATTAKVATLPNNTGTVAELNLAQSWTADQTLNTTSTGLMLPKLAAAVPTVDGNIATDTTSHFTSFGSNGTTYRIPLTNVMASASSASTSTTLAQSGGMTIWTWNLTAGKTYSWQCDIYYQVSSTTGGPGLAMGSAGTATWTSIVYALDGYTNTTAVSEGTVVTTAGNKSSMAADGLATTNLPVRFRGSGVVNAAGTFLIDFANLIAAGASVTIGLGSTCTVQ